MTYSRGKLTKYRLLARHLSLQACLPATKPLSKKYFSSMLDKYSEVIVKPSSSWGGAGVIQVTSRGNGNYEVHYEKKKKKISGRESAYAWIRKKTKGKKHLVQRRIRLAKVHGRPFDIRIMMQRKKKSSWKVTGKLAKIAGPGYIVTNVARSKGRVAPLSRVIHSSNIHGKSAKKIEKKMNKIAIKAAKCLQKYYRLKTVGLDVGLDRNGKIWIIEANFSPAKSLFKKLKDKSMYKRIMSY